MSSDSKAENGVDWTAEPDNAGLASAHKLLKEDSDAALVAFKALAERGSVMSMLYIADMFKFGIGRHSDLSIAETWYRRAAELGSVRALYGLGRLLFRTGRREEGIDLLRRAAEMGFVPAIHLLGRAYLEGKGTERDIAKAEELLQRASLSGNLYAKRALASLLMKHGQTLSDRMRGFWLIWSSLAGITKATLFDRTSDRLR